MLEQLSRWKPMRRAWILSDEFCKCSFKCPHKLHDAITQLFPINLIDQMIVTKRLNFYGIYRMYFGAFAINLFSLDRYKAARHKTPVTPKLLRMRLNFFIWSKCCRCPVVRSTNDNFSFKLVALIAFKIHIFWLSIHSCSQ